MEMVVVAVDRWSSHEGMYISIIEMVHVSHSVDRWSLYTGTYIRMLASLRRSMGYPKVVTMDTCPLCTYVRTVVKWSLWTGVTSAHTYSSKVVTMDRCPLCTYVRTVVKWSLWTGVTSAHTYSSKVVTMDWCPICTVQ